LAALRKDSLGVVIDYSNFHLSLVLAYRFLHRDNRRATVTMLLQAFCSYGSEPLHLPFEALGMSQMSV
jgi:hypothetical protein